MAASSGRDMLVKRSDGAGGWTTVAGLRTNTLSLNQEIVDITNKDSTDHWRELLAGGGVRSAKVTGSGVFTDAALDATLQADFFADALVSMQFVVPGFGAFSGSFVINQMDYSGEYNGASVYTLGFESAGVIAFA